MIVKMMIKQEDEVRRGRRREKNQSFINEMRELGSCN